MDKEKLTVFEQAQTESLEKWRGAQDIARQLVDAVCCNCGFCNGYHCDTCPCFTENLCGSRGHSGLFNSIVDNLRILTTQMQNMVDGLYNLKEE